MTQIIINSFQGGLSNDRNTGTNTFWNSKNIEFQKNSSYIELSKGVAAEFSTSTKKPVALNYWYNSGGTVAQDLVAFCSDGSVYTSAGLQGTVPHSILNTIEANSIKYIICANKLYSFDAINTYTLKTTFTASVNTRPAIVFGGDLIIGDGNKVLRYNYDTTLVEFTAGSSTSVIGNLDGEVYAITSIGSIIYVWCNNGVNTNLYIWDGVSGDWSQKIVYNDMPVRNVALLKNQHYWWSTKSSQGIRHINVGEQTIVKSDYPKYPVTTYPDEEENRLAITDLDFSVNAIESMNDKVYLPGIGSIYGVGKYFPNQNISVSREFSFTGTYVSAMTAGGLTAGSRDVSGILAFACLNGSTHSVKLINQGMYGNGLSILYQSEGEIETMEYDCESYLKEEDNKKHLVNFYLPHASTSIEVYQKIDRGSYELIKTINTTEYGVGYGLAEIANSGRWNKIQWKYKLITGDTSYTPQLGMGIINISDTTGRSL